MFHCVVMINEHKDQLYNLEENDVLPYQPNMTIVRKEK
jgi:hypothetical protein